MQLLRICRASAAICTIILPAPVRVHTASTDTYGLSAALHCEAIWNALKFAFARTGPLASNVFESVAFLRTSAGLDRPDFQFVFQPANPPLPGRWIPRGHGYGISPVLLYPNSRGSIRLASADPDTAPLIDPRLLDHPADLARMVGAVRLARRILEAPAFSQYHASEYLPGAKVTSDADIESFIRSTLPDGASSRGYLPDGHGPEAVVDGELRVNGIESSAGCRCLRVSIDSSAVTPMPPRSWWRSEQLILSCTARRRLRQTGLRVMPLSRCFRRSHDNGESEHRPMAGWGCRDLQHSGSHRTGMTTSTFCLRMPHRRCC